MRLELVNPEIEILATIHFSKRRSERQNFLSDGVDDALTFWTLRRNDETAIHHCPLPHHREVDRAKSQIADFKPSWAFVYGQLLPPAIRTHASGYSLYFRPDELSPAVRDNHCTVRVHQCEDRSRFIATSTDCLSIAVTSPGAVSRH